MNSFKQRHGSAEYFFQKEGVGKDSTFYVCLDHAQNVVLTPRTVHVKEWISYEWLYAKMQYKKDCCNGAAVQMETRPKRVLSKAIRLGVFHTAPFYFPFETKKAALQVPRGRKTFSVSFAAGSV